jgi:heat shock protein HspQ
MDARIAKFAIGQLVRHRLYPFRGVVFDVDPQFANTEDWYQAIPEDIRPRKDQPFYHLLAENDQSAYVAYVSEQNLLPDETGLPVGHPHAALIFDSFRNGHYVLRPHASN